MDQAKYWRVFYKIQGIMIEEFNKNTQEANSIAHNTAVEWIDKLEEPTIVLTTKEVYHTYLNELDKDLRQFVDQEVVADCYFLGVRIESEQVIGGFAIAQTGELKGLFALEKGYGEFLFKSQVRVAQKTYKGKKLFVVCIGEFLKKLYFEFGFEWTHIFRWDERLAPKNWNGQKFGFPNVYRMELK